MGALVKNGGFFCVMPKSLGQIAYEAYFESSKGKSLISGAPLPEFDGQREDVRTAWEAAAEAVTAALLRRTATTS